MKTINRLSGMFFILSLLFLNSCASLPVRYLEKKVSRIAVLPTKNETADLRAPGIVRVYIGKELSSKGYRTIDPVRIDAILAENGILDAGELGMASPQEIGRWSGADLLLYSTANEWNHTFLGAMERFTAEVSFQLVDAQTGETLWRQDGIRSSRTRQYAGGAAAAALGSPDLLQRDISTMTKAPEDVVSKICEKALRTAPFPATEEGKAMAAAQSRKEKRVAPKVEKGLKATAEGLLQVSSILVVVAVVMIIGALSAL